MSVSPFGFVVLGVLCWVLGALFFVLCCRLAFFALFLCFGPVGFLAVFAFVPCGFFVVFVFLAGFFCCCLGVAPRPSTSNWQMSQGWVNEFCPAMVSGQAGPGKCCACSTGKPWLGAISLTKVCGQNGQLAWLLSLSGVGNEVAVGIGDGVAGVDNGVAVRMVVYKNQNQLVWSPTMTVGGHTGTRLL